MRQVLQNYRTGEARVDGVPAPALRSEAVLVSNHHVVWKQGALKMFMWMSGGRAKKCIRAKTSVEASFPYIPSLHLAANDFISFPILASDPYTC